MTAAMTPQPRPMTVGTYRDRGGKWRWRLTGANGERFAASQPYTREASAKRAARRLVEAGKQGIELDAA